MSRGFSLVELIVAVGITMLVASGVFTQYNSYTNQQAVKQATLTLKENLRYAQLKALSGDKPQDVACVQFVGYTVTFDTNSYATQAQCRNALGAMVLVGEEQIVALPQSVSFIAPPASITLSVLTGKTTSSGNESIVLQHNANQSVQYQIIVTPNGDMIQSTGTFVLPSITPTQVPAQTPTPTAIAPTPTSTGPTPTSVPNSPTTTTTVAPTPTPTPVGNTVVTLYPEVDTKVADTTPDSATGGTSTTLRVVFDASGETSRSYLRFNISNITGTVVSAVLRLNITNASANSQTIKRVGNVTWTESMTWNTGQPTLGTAVTTITGPSSLGWLSKDVTTWVTERVSASATKISFGIDSSSGGDGFEFSSREGTDPELVVTYQ